MAYSVRQAIDPHPDVLASPPDLCVVFPSTGDPTPVNPPWTTGAYKTATAQNKPAMFTLGKLKNMAIMSDI